MSRRARDGGRPPTRNGGQVAQLTGEPPGEVLAGARWRAGGEAARARSLVRHFEAALEHLARAGDVGGRDHQGRRLASCSAAPAVSDSTSAGVAHDRGLLGDQVHAVDDRVDQHDVGQLQGRDRQRVLGAVEQPDRARRRDRPCR